MSMLTDLRETIIKKLGILELVNKHFEARIESGCVVIKEKK